MVSDQAFPAWGGEGVATQNLCRKLAERGHYVLFLTTDVPAPPGAEGIEIIRFPGIFIPHRGYFAFALFPRIMKILRERKIEIIHVNLPTFLGWQSFIAAKKLNLPCVAGFHVQVENVVNSDSFFYPFFKLLLERWFSFFYQMAEVVISPSELGKRIIQSCFPGKVEVVSNGVDLKRFNPHFISTQERRSFREKFGLGASDILLYVGRLSREKNVFFLLDILEILRGKSLNVRLLIVGKGKLEEALQRNIASRKMENMVIFTGYLPEGELLLAYSEADIFILPSLVELQSIVTLEAMAMGCAVLVGKSPTSAACEMIKEGENGYTFDLKDPQDAAQKIEFILSDPLLKNSMKKASLEIARRHEIELSISKIEEVYRSFLSENHPA